MIGIRTSQFLDLDSSDGLAVCNSAFSHARDHLSPRLDQFKRDYQLFNGFIDMTQRDPDRSNSFIPKIQQIIRTKVPRSVKALSSQRPYIPFTSTRTEFNEGVRVWVDYIDALLEDGYWFPQLVWADLMAHVYGTSYLDFTPYLEMGQRKATLTQTMPLMRLGMHIKAWAPWEVYPDPFATGLEQPGQCRYLVKIQLASRRQIIKMAREKGMYPGLDIDAMMDNRHVMGTDNIAGQGGHPGLTILQMIGINKPKFDPDIGVLMRFESDDRYIDTWNGVIPLRDRDNPYPCKCIHTTRMVHGIDAHTQNQFHGIGDVKPNEVLQELLNDMTDQAINSWNMMDQPVTYYDEEAFGNANQLVRTMGNKIPFKRPRDADRIQDILYESFGHELPRSHFEIHSMIREFMDMASQSTPVSRGEISDDDPTATEVGLASERSADAQELDVKLSEHITLRSCGRKIVDTVCSLSSVVAQDIIDRVGLNRATMALLMNPLGIPGGINMTFKGSDRVQNMAINQRQWILLAKQLSSLGSVLPGALSKKLLEVFDEDSPEALAMIIPDEIRMAMEQAQAELQHRQQIELRAGGGAGSEGGAGDRKAGTARQVGQETGQAIRNNTRAS